MKTLALILLLSAAQQDTTRTVVMGIELVEGAYNNFAVGYSDGWVDGYCQLQSTNNCNFPYPPAAPPMRPQDKDTYKSGYSRGFADGLKIYRKRNR